MLNQIQISYPHISNTIYVVIRDTVGKVWNGSAFETWIDGSIANYDIACTYKGGNLYSVDFPASIARGYYTIQIVIQSGAVPSTSDLPLDGALGYWDADAGNLLPVRVDTLVEYSNGERFTEKALEEVAGGGVIKTIERAPKTRVEASEVVDIDNIPADVEVLPAGTKRTSSARAGTLTRNSSSRVGP